MEGQAVTLHCLNKMTSNTTADFYRDGVFVGRGAAGSMTIHTVHRSDEGLYRCSVPGAGESAERRLTVRACPLESLCYDQLPVVLYILMRTVVTVLWIGLVVCHCGRNG
ncbi:hypothetical protein INR49_001238 [Caranx melampygus]|nr:hypothetical protein INR49_001238 [Caranx melampygus]